MQTKNPIVENDSNPTTTSTIHQVEDLTINWHITEACNYRCQYCYAHWKDQPDRRELFHHPERTIDLLEQVFRFFHPENTQNPLRKVLSWKAVRLNIAGGEPSILKGRLVEIARTARQLGFRLSIISNGSKLSHEALQLLAPDLTCLGISLDSTDPAINRAIGRNDRHGKLLDVNELIENLRTARLLNPSMTIKLNTVVNRLNAGEDLSHLIEQVQPDRWKVLRMLPVLDKSLAVSDKQFAAYVHKHKAFAPIQCIEDHEDMCESYLMIDPFGRFFQNRPTLSGDGYVYSKPILSVGAGVAFSKMAFNPVSFQSRYTDGRLS